LRGEVLAALVSLIGALVPAAFLLARRYYERSRSAHETLLELREGETFVVRLKLTSKDGTEVVHEIPVDDPDQMRAALAWMRKGGEPPPGLLPGAGSDG
jgi:hypothetical protein